MTVPIVVLYRGDVKMRINQYEFRQNGVEFEPTKQQIVQFATDQLAKDDKRIAELEKQLNELSNENYELGRENEQLRQENAKLRKQQNGN